MSAFLRGARSLLSVLSVGLLFVLGSVALRLVVLPGARLFPRRRFLLVSVYMKLMAGGIIALLTLGGARFRRLGTLPTDAPVLIVANHQSLLDILQVTLMAKPRVPAFVTRRRYARFIPLVSASVRLLGCPIVDPKRDAAGAIEAVRRGALLPHGLIVFPEGHRTRSGEILPFRTTGCETVLGERPMPVYLVLNEGAWRVRRFVDLLLRVHEIDAFSEVIGPFEPPADPAALREFVRRLRGVLVERLAQRRGASLPAR